MSDVHRSCRTNTPPHRAFAERDRDGVWWAKCSCGWKTRWHFGLAAKREAKAHRRYPNGNPRINALREEADHG